MAGVVVVCGCPCLVLSRPLHGPPLHCVLVSPLLFVCGFVEWRMGVGCVWCVMSCLRVGFVCLVLSCLSFRIVLAFSSVLCCSVVWWCVVVCCLLLHSVVHVVCVCYEWWWCVGLVLLFSYVFVFAVVALLV